MFAHGTQQFGVPAPETVFAEEQGAATAAIQALIASGPEVIAFDVQYPEEGEAMVLTFATFASIVSIDLARVAHLPLLARDIFQSRLFLKIARGVKSK